MKDFLAISLAAVAGANLRYLLSRLAAKLHVLCPQLLARLGRILLAHRSTPFVAGARALRAPLAHLRVALIRSR